MENKERLSRALMFEFEKIDSNEGIVKELMIVENPLAGSFKVSNGEITAYIYMHNKTVEVFVIDENGNIKNKEISLE